MKIEHIAVWVDDLELVRRFYTTYFDVTCGEKYINPKRNLTSYFLSFGEGRSWIELMHHPDRCQSANRDHMKGWTHVAISVGGKEAVDALTEKLRRDGYTIA